MAIDHRALFERFVSGLNRRDLSVFDELLTDDFVDEYPQSGEIVRGRQNNRAIIENYPGGPMGTGADAASVRTEVTDAIKVVAPLFTVVRVQAGGDTGTCMLKTKYPDGSAWWVIR